MQVLSDSMAKAIQFYRENQNIDTLKNSEETEKFTLVFNFTFDALNRKYPAEGIRKNSKDFEVCIKQIIFFYISFFLSYILGFK